MAVAPPSTSGTVPTDSNRKRSRSPSDADQKQHKRANTGAPPSSNESSRADDSSLSPAAAAVMNEQDVAMNGTDTAASTQDDTAASTPTAADGKVDLSTSSTQPTTDGTQADPSASATATAAISSTSGSSPSAMIHMRCLIVTQDASIIIGRGGKHVNEIREKSGARVMVSESIPGNPERILNVSGPLDAVSKVCTIKVLLLPEY